MGVFFRRGVSADRLMMTPVRRPPMALPQTAGKRWAPALVTDACDVIWKYRGTVYITYRAISNKTRNAIWGFGV